MSAPHHHTHTPLTIENCMSRKFVSFKSSLPVVEAAMSLVTNELIGGPVVDDNGNTPLHLARNGHKYVVQF